MQDILSEKATVEELVARLLTEELAEFCVGTLRADGGEVVGNASYTVPGATGRYLFCMQRIKRNQEYDTCRWSLPDFACDHILRRKRMEHFFQVER